MQDESSTVMKQSQDSARRVPTSLLRCCCLLLLNGLHWALDFSITELNPKSWISNMTRSWAFRVEMKRGLRLRELEGSIQLMGQGHGI